MALVAAVWQQARAQMLSIYGCCGPLLPLAPPRWDDGRPRSAKAREGAHAYDWIAGMFDGARRAAARARDHLTRFIAVKVGRWGVAALGCMRHCALPCPLPVSLKVPFLPSLPPLLPQLVYGDLRDVIFERLYRFHVQVSRLEMVLQVNGGRACGLG